MDIRTLHTYEKEDNYTRVYIPSQMSREEKDDLLFTLLEQLKLGVFRHINNQKDMVLAPLNVWIG